MTTSERRKVRLDDLREAVAILSGKVVELGTALSALEAWSGAVAKELTAMQEENLHLRIAELDERVAALEEAK